MAYCRHSWSLDARLLRDVQGSSFLKHEKGCILLRYGLVACLYLVVLRVADSCLLQLVDLSITIWKHCDFVTNVRLISNGLGSNDVYLTCIGHCDWTR